MARAFAAASTQKLEFAGGVVTDEPLSMACWFNPVATTVNYCLMSIGTSGATGSSFRLDAKAVTNAKLAVLTQSSTVSGIGETSTTYGAGAWAHAACVITSNTSRDVYLNGGGKGSDATDVTPNGTLNRTDIGVVIFAGSPFSYADATIAEAAIWNVALTDAEVLLLAQGYSPLFVRPQSLVSYWPLIGRTSPEIDLVGKSDLTLTNTPTNAAHPRIIYPKRRTLLTVPAAAAGDAVPVCWQQYRHRRAS